MTEGNKRRNLIPDLKRLRGAWLQPSISNFNEFFKELAKAAKESFKADKVTLWDNGVYTDSLLLLGSYPSQKDAHYTIPKKGSLTGLAIKRCEIIQQDNLPANISELEVFNQAGRKENEVPYMISIPVPNVFNPQLAIFVINLHFAQPVNLKNQHLYTLREWVLRGLGISLDYLLLRVSEEINHFVIGVSFSASGRLALFEKIYNKLQSHTHCGSATLLLWDRTTQKLLPETSSSETFVSETQIDLMTKECIHKERSIMMLVEKNSREVIENNDKDGGGLMAMATPIFIEIGEPFGVLQCLQKDDAESHRPFSSFDMYVLECFARSIYPSVKRFSKMPEKSVLMAVAEKVSAATVRATDLDEILQYTIETLTESLNTSVGSIFLLEDTEEGSRKLIMRAATGVHKELIGKAEYEIGEGLTGYIASEGGKLLNFKTLEERQAHPEYVGKYNLEDKIEKKHRNEPGFLGVPILLDGQVLGVWKIEYLRPSINMHPDSYFTDEDEQMARVLSVFLAYIIENDRYKQAKAREFKTLEEDFKLLAESSVAIQAKQTEDDAILELMSRLEKSGWKNALLSLYDAATKQLVGKIGSGAWHNLVGVTRHDLSSAHALTLVLREGKPKFFEDASKYSFNQKLVKEVKAKAICVLPMRVGEELIGTLGVDMGTRTEMNADEELLLQVSANHLSLAISRIRITHELIAFINSVMSRSRFIVAEALSSVAVHSLNHTLERILRSLKEDLQRPEIRGKKELKETLEKWEELLEKGKEDLEKALKMVRAIAGNTHPESVDLHPLIQPSIDNWFPLLSQNKCSVHSRLKATWSHCGFSPHAFSEIISVMLVNSVQAYAHEIEIETFNQDEYDLPLGNYVAPAFCLRFSDDGVGFSTDDVEEIFDPTYTTKPEKFGTGLGLFIARTLARRGGGDMVAVLPTPKSKGATFHLVLPVEQVSS